MAGQLPELDATALFATDSVVTHGAFRALQRLGVRVPDELSFVGFDDQDWTTLVNPQITVLTQPLRSLAWRRQTCSASGSRGRPIPPTMSCCAVSC